MTSESLGTSQLKKPTCRQGRVHGRFFPGVHLFPRKSIGSQGNTVPAAAVGLFKRTAAWTENNSY